MIRVQHREVLYSAVQDMQVQLPSWSGVHFREANYHWNVMERIWCKGAFGLTLEGL